VASPNIFAAYAQPMRTVADYEDQYAQRDLRAQQLQAAQQQNAIQALTMRQQQAQMGEAEQDRNALQRIAAGWGADTTPDQRIAALRGSGRSALMQQADALEQSYFTRRKTDAEVGKIEAETADKRFGTQDAKRKAAVQQVASLGSPQEAMALLQSSAASGELPANLVPALSSLIQTDPRWQVKLMMGIADPSKMAEVLMPHIQTNNVGGRTVTQAVDKLTGAPTITGSIANTQSPDSAASVAATLRGQNMADARAREANSISKEAQQTQLVNDPVQGLLLVNKGTKTAVQAMGPNGQPIPSETSAKRTAGAKRVLDLLSEAEKLIPQATGSYAGAAADQAAKVVGIGTGGAQAGAQLKALEGAILAEMPRMEGPQSNLDVAMYKQAAGELGDPTTPGSIKRAALQTIRQIQTRYSGATPSARPAGPKPTVSNW
jgi:hypothetical protein